MERRDRTRRPPRQGALTSQTIHLVAHGRYRVAGVLHRYLGLASSVIGGEVVHAFGRGEWRPNTPGQVPITLVPDSEISRLVTNVTQRRPGAAGHRT
jgi:hypothetical protein